MIWLITKRKLLKILEKDCKDWFLAYKVDKESNHQQNQLVKRAYMLDVLGEVWKFEVTLRLTKREEV